MNRKWLQFGLILGVLLLVSLACSVKPSTSDGSVQSFDEWGVSFAPPKGTIVMDFLGPSVQAEKTDQSPEDNMLGPVCQIGTYDHENFSLDKSSQWKMAASRLTSNMGLTQGEPTETTLNGEPALVGDVSGTMLAEMDSKATPISGRAMMASIQDKRIFDLICFGPASRQAETLEMFDAIVGSVKFYEPIVPTPVP